MRTTTTIQRYAAGGAVLMAIGLALVGGISQASWGILIQQTTRAKETPDFAWRAGSLALADFNRDGQIEAVVPGLYMAGICVVVSDLLETWVDTGPWPTAVAAADFNGDGWTDVAVAEAEGGGVAIYTNNGVGALSRTSFYATGDSGTAVGPTAVLAVDLDKDGRTDLVVANRFAETVVVLHNTGGGFMVWQTIAVSNEPNALVAADLDNDGWVDIAVACAADDTVKILHNNNGVLSLAGTFDAGPYPVAVAAGDLNGDGYIDLAVADREAPQVTVLLSDGAGGFSTSDVLLVPTGYGEFEPPVDVQLVDTNGDGKIDIRCAGKVILNDGAGNFQPDASFIVCDEVYAETFLPGAPYPYLGIGTRSTMSGSTNWVTMSYQAPPKLHSVTGDIDGDGHVDVVDLLWLVGSFGRSVGDAGFVPGCDLSRDGSVDMTDLLILVGNFGA